MRHDGWQKVKLADICASIDYGYTASASENPVGPKFLRITDIVPGFIDWNSVPYCSVSEKEAVKYKLYDGDIVLARTGATTGASAYVKNPPDALFASYLVRLRIAATADARYISYWLKSSAFWNYIKGVLGDKSAQPNASAHTMTQAVIWLPPLHEQRAISSVLDIIDRKIDINRRMNETLEAMARAIFQSWFVDFDPVRAKAEGRQPWGMDAATAALFPERLVDGIPAGWGLEKIGAVAEINKSSIGRHWPYDEIEYVDIASVSEGHLSETSKIMLSEAPSRAKRCVTHGDTIWSCVRPNRRSFLFISNPSSNMVVSTGFAVLSPVKVTPNYLYLWTTTQEFTDYLTANADGSAYPAVRPEHFASAEILLPPKSILNSFEQVVAPYRDKIHHNLDENRTLADLRDTLLPKLMAGEIRIKEAEQKIEEFIA